MIGRHILGSVVYLLSVCSLFFVVEVLRLAGSANHYIEWMAIVLMASALTDLGVPNSLQWSLLSQKDRCAVKFSIASGVANYFSWIKLSIKGFKNLYILSGLIFLIFIIVVLIRQNLPNLPATNEIYWIYAIISIVAINVRKIVSAFLDGAGLFLLSRLILALPNSIIALILALRILFGFPELSSSEIISVSAASYFFVSLLGILILCLPSVYSQMPIVAKKNGKQSEASIKWYVLSITSTIQSQVFYILAPKFGINEFMVPVFYTQKAVQVSSELIGQFIKEWTHAAMKKNITWWADSQLMTIYLSILPALIGGIAFIYPNQTLNLEIFSILTFVVVEAGMANLFTCRGYIALMNDKTVPVFYFLLGGVSQLILTLTLVPIIGVVGLYISALISGVLFSYRANQKIYKEISP